MICLTGIIKNFKGDERENHYVIITKEDTYSVHTGKDYVMGSIIIKEQKDFDAYGFSFEEIFETKETFHTNQVFKKITQKGVRNDRI